MSLKVFHIFFISLAILMVLGCGVGATHAFLHGGAASALALAIISFASAIALICYEVWFIRKARRLIL